MGPIKSLIIFGFTLLLSSSVFSQLLTGQIRPDISSASCYDQDVIFKIIRNDFGVDQYSYSLTPVNNVWLGVEVLNPAIPERLRNLDAYPAGYIDYSGLHLTPKQVQHFEALIGSGEALIKGCFIARNRLPFEVDRLDEYGNLETITVRFGTVIFSANALWASSGNGKVEGSYLRISPELNEKLQMIEMYKVEKLNTTIAALTLGLKFLLPYDVTYLSAEQFNTTTELANSGDLLVAGGTRELFLPHLPIRGVNITEVFFPFPTYEKQINLPPEAYIY